MEGRERESEIAKKRWAESNRKNEMKERESSEGCGSVR